MLTLGSNCMFQTSDGGASSVAIEELDSTSKTLMKLSSDADAAKVPAGWAATETTPNEWPLEGGPAGERSSSRHKRTVSSRDPVKRRDGRSSVAGIQDTAHIDSSWAFSIDLRPASFIDFGFRFRNETAAKPFQTLEILGF